LKAAVLPLAAGLVLFGCTDYQTHVLPGQLYEAARDCIDPTTSIDIVDGPDPGTCSPPTCIVTPAGQNGGATGIYVTTECGPYPPLDDTSGSEALCTAALAAFAQGNVCASDADASLEGGSSGGEGGGD
jgi:hypothetical protein